MSSVYRQALKYYKFRGFSTKKGKSISYLFFHKWEETYFALQHVKLINERNLTCPISPSKSDWLRTFILIISGKIYN